MQSASLSKSEADLFSKYATKFNLEFKIKQKAESLYLEYKGQVPEVVSLSFHCYWDPL